MKNLTLTQNEIKQVQLLILEWYDNNKRLFPWRETTNPYKILIAEKLLQQTTASQRVVDAYLSICKKYPDIESLSLAKQDEINYYFLPLGLFFRAQELIIIAQSIHNQYSGIVPDNYELLTKLPGIGSYSARAILCFAHNENIGIVDINIARFLIRFFGLDIPLPTNPARQKSLLDLATSLIPVGKSRDFNFGLLDLCSLLCTSKKIQCVICPINIFCYFFNQSSNSIIINN